jgi:excinuclease ABC subunit A
MTRPGRLAAAAPSEHGLPLRRCRPRGRAAPSRARTSCDRQCREHNLKALNVDIPHGKFNVITGVSGSGKSTLAFDILFHEGQRRYLESLNAYARSIVQPAGRPEVDAVYGIPPTVAIEQRLSRGGRKSTVATTSEVWHFLRLLYVKLGIQHCVHDGAPVTSQSPASIVAQLLRDHRGQHVGCWRRWWSTARVSIPIWPSGPRRAATRICALMASSCRSIRGRAWTASASTRSSCRWAISSCRRTTRRTARAAGADAELGKGVMHLLAPLDGLHDAMQGGKNTGHVGETKVFSTKRACPVCGTSYPELDPRMFSYNSKHGWCNTCVGTGLALTREQRAAFDDTVLGGDDRGREQSLPSEEQEPEGVGDAACPDCSGTRLNPVARAVTFDTNAITDVAQWTVSDTRRWVDGLRLKGRDAEIARDVVTEIASRLQFLEEVGLGYLSLDRAAPSLSGGEAQRIRLAAQLGSNLQGVCYVLDEPTIGLHPRDNQILLDACASSATRAIRWWWWSTTKTRSAAPITSSTSARAPASAVAAWWRRAAWALAAAKDSTTGQFLAHPMIHPLQARRPVTPHARASPRIRRNG